MALFENANYDFIKWRWHAIALSWVVILAGLVVIWTKGIPRGIEFAGGTAVITQFENDVRQGLKIDTLPRLAIASTPGSKWRSPL